MDNRRNYSLLPPEPSQGSDLLSSLNEIQAQAARHVDGPLLILAGAGSGKTRVMTHRIAYLISECGVWPEQILAMTFTNKACGEMRDRVDEILGPDRSDESRRVTISTFHSLGARLLRLYARDIDLAPNFVIYDDADQLSLIKRLMEDEDRGKDRAEARRLRGFIEAMKNRGLTPTQAHEQVFDSYTEENVYFYELYQAALTEANCVDFGDLIMGMLRVFRKNPDIAKSLSNQWRYVMVDEFQDTNPAQFELLQHFTASHQNLAVVGDDDQAIYRWRGATVANILGFEEDFSDATVVKLEQNYRSTQVILDAANDVIKLNTRRREKRLWTENKGGALIRCFTGTDDREEATFVARRIGRLVADGVRAGEISVFYRTNAQGRAFEEQLRFAQVPYRVVGGISFYARGEIKDILAYLKVASNPKNEVDLLRVLNKPNRGIGATTIDKLRIAAANPVFGGSLWSVIEYIAEGQPVPTNMSELGAFEDPDLGSIDKLRGRSKSGLVDFHALIVELQESLAEEQQLATIVNRILERTSYLAWLESSDPERAEDRTRNVGELVSAVHEFEQEYHASSAESDPTAERTLRAFLERSSLVQSTDDLATGAVTLMTVHGSKGLEFEVVFMAGMEDEIFPSVRSEDPEELDEERRLAYVAITRAKKRLYITNAKRRRIFGQYRVTTPSRFILDIDPARLEMDPESSSKYVDFARMSATPRYRQTKLMSPDNSMWDFDQSTQQTIRSMHQKLVASRDEFSQETAYREAEFEAQVEAPSPKGDLVGRSVFHATFGDGKILKASGKGPKTVLTIKFPSVGEKRVVRKFVKLK